MRSSGHDRRVKAVHASLGVLAVLLLAGWLFARTTGASTTKEATSAAEGRTSSYSGAIRRIASVNEDGLVIPSRPFSDAVQRLVAPDPTVARVRVWSAAALLVISTDPKDGTGRGGRPPEGLDVALGGETNSQDARVMFTPLGGEAATTDTLTQTFMALRLQEGAKPAGAVEVDFVRSRLVSPLWRTLSIAFAVGAAFCGLLFVFSMRRPAGTAAPIKKVEPPVTTTIRHDYGAARRRANNGWVAPSGDGPPPPTSVADLEAATIRIAELERALQASAAEAEEVRSQAASQEQDIERLRQEANDRAAALEEKAHADDPEIEALRTKLTDAESRASEAESLLTTAYEELAAAHAQVGDTPVHEEGEDPRRSGAQPQAGAEPAEPAPEPEPEPADPTDLIAVLEAKVAEAEARVAQAKDEAMQLSPEASDLRSRLARTAARKKMGSAG
jgi:hypothetical protein